MYTGIDNNIIEKSIGSLVNTLWETDHPTAIWRLPNSPDFHLIYSLNKSQNYRKIDFEELPGGFAFAPFENADTKSLFIEADYYQSFHDFEESIVKDLPGMENIKFSDPTRNTIDFTSENYISEENVKDKSDFLQKVSNATALIKAGNLEKVVLSRHKKVIPLNKFNPISQFQKLSSKYPNAFISLVYLPWQKEIWVGATPEKLVEQDANGIFRTMSLAGTQPSCDCSGNTISEKMALWTQKEIEEQALVGRYIINCFKKIRVREYTEIGPRTVNAGNLLHLQSIFEVNTRGINFPQLGSVMLDLLHPTSAVCGMPKDKALEIIRNSEKYDREYYSGFLGPVNINEESRIYVNLRTMKYANNEINLFSGCGITADSEPEKEWMETQIKMLTVLP